MLKESQLDELVAPMLFWKFEMGLFDDPYVDPAEAERIAGSEPHRALAHTAAREAITLLKNENNVAPLDLSKIKAIAVIGPNANRTLLGGYSGVPKHEVTVLEGIRAKVGKRAKVLYSEGCKITISGSWNQDEVPRATRKKTAGRSPKRSKWRKRPTSSSWPSAATSRPHARRGTCSTWATAPASTSSAARKNWSKPWPRWASRSLRFCSMAGRFPSTTSSQHVPVIFECWYLGQETGHAIADVLFGDYNPGGKLPISFPRSAGHLPVFYNYKPSARRGYLFDDVSPLFAFGYGLSYTTFSVANPRLTKKKIHTTGSTQVLVDVTNTGKREGEEVIQLYIRDLVSSVTRPIKELKGFRKVSLQPGETRTVALDITPDSLAFFDVNMKYVVEPGDFEIMVGTSSRDVDLQKLNLRVSK